MFKFRKMVAFLGLLCFLNLGVLFAEGSTVTGIIDSVGENNIVVNGQKIVCDAEFIKEAYFEQGDNVKIMVENTKDGLKAVDYEYIYDTEDETESSEEATTDTTATTETTETAGSEDSTVKTDTATETE